MTRPLKNRRCIDCHGELSLARAFVNPHGRFTRIYWCDWCDLELECTQSMAHVTDRDLEGLPKYGSERQGPQR